MKVNDVLNEDLFRFVGSLNRNISVKLRYLFFTAGFRYIFFLRHANMAKTPLSRFFWIFLLRQSMLKTGIQIPYNTHIGRGFRIVHFGHIVVNPMAVIGDNFNICQGCLIGNAEGKRSGVPIIGNNVCMQPNSIIIGGVKIGNDVLIAPGAFVNFDVPDQSIVIGNPGKIIPRIESPTKKYIVYPI